MVTPSETILASAREDIVITDSRGRSIRVRRLNALDRLRLFKALGSQLVENTAYFGVAFLAASVTEIDNVPVPWPTGELQIEGIVGRLGDDGLDAVSDALGSGAELDADAVGN